MALPKLDLVGKRFGRLLAESYAGKSKWKCLCDCGAVIEVCRSNLITGTTESCGCLHREQLGNRVRSHGMTKTPTYVAWCNMKGRCLNPKQTGYENYGGRGIKVCDRWLNSFENFLADMGERPEGMSLDRDDTDGNYEPGNCRWVPWVKQMNNQRKTIRITHEGRTMSMSEWAAELDIKPSKIRGRLRAGKSAAEALGLA